MTTAHATIAVAILIGLTGCASVLTGHSQKLTLNTDPPGADCMLTRNDLAIGRVNPTPGVITVQRAKDAIRVTCVKEGHQEATYVNKSGFEAAVLGNVLIGGLVGVAVDATSGATNKYEEVMNIQLAATGTAQTSPASTEAVPAPASDVAGAPAAVPRIERYASEVAPFHCPAAGTLIRTSSQASFKFTGGAGLTCNYLDQYGAARQRYAIVADGFGRMARPDLDGLWPLKVGNRIEFRIVDPSATSGSTAWSKRDYQETFTVVRREPVTVPGGTFDTFVIEWHETGTAQNNESDAIVTLWYAPGTGYVVKSAVRILALSATDPFAKSQYSGMDYEATEIVTPNAESALRSGPGADRLLAAPSPASRNPAGP